MGNPSKNDLPAALSLEELAQALYKDQQELQSLKTQISAAKEKPLLRPVELNHDFNLVPTLRYGVSNASQILIFVGGGIAFFALIGFATGSIGLTAFLLSFGIGLFVFGRTIFKILKSI